jgi:hypothetical protein
VLVFNAFLRLGLQ